MINMSSDKATMQIGKLPDILPGLDRVYQKYYDDVSGRVTDLSQNVNLQDSCCYL